MKFLIMLIGDIAADCTLAQPALQLALNALVGIEGRLQIPHDEFPADLVGGNDELAEEFEGQPGRLLFGIVHDDLGQASHG